LYCVTEYLNYQGLELAKGLLLISWLCQVEKVKLTDDFAINYLKIFGAYCFVLIFIACSPYLRSKLPWGVASNFFIFIFFYSFAMRLTFVLGLQLLRNLLALGE
jgi:hypothetical protein